MVTNLQNNLTVFNENKIIILKLLFTCESHLCGCDLVKKMDLPKNLISYHISTLEKLGYIEAVRCGRKKNYRINPASRSKVRKILEIVEII